MLTTHKLLCSLKNLDKALEARSTVVALFPDGVLCGLRMLTHNKEFTGVHVGFPILDFGESVNPGAWELGSLDMKYMRNAVQFDLADGCQTIRIHNAAGGIWEIPLPNDRRAMTDQFGLNDGLLSTWHRNFPFEGFDLQAFHNDRDVIIYDRRQDKGGMRVMMTLTSDQFGLVSELMEKLDFVVTDEALKTLRPTCDLKTARYLVDTNQPAMRKPEMKKAPLPEQTQTEMFPTADDETAAKRPVGAPLIDTAQASDQLPAETEQKTPFDGSTPPADGGAGTANQPPPPPPADNGETGEGAGDGAGEGDAAPAGKGKGKRTPREADDLDKMLIEQDLEGVKAILSSSDAQEAEFRSDRRRIITGLMRIIKSQSARIVILEKEGDALAEKKAKDMCVTIKVELEKKMSEDFSNRVRQQAAALLKSIGDPLPTPAPAPKE